MDTPWKDFKSFQGGYLVIEVWGAQEGESFNEKKTALVQGKRKKKRGHPGILETNLE